MLIFILFIGTIILGIIGIMALAKGKKSCSCIGKPCGETDGCGNQCCDPSKGQSCDQKTGLCCDNTCETCKGVSGCGIPCEKIKCCENCVCDDTGSCCSMETCQPGSCERKCGQRCKCPSEPGHPQPICDTSTDKCCTPDDCSTGICDNDPPCGSKCTCNDNYCSDGCCQDNQCVYNNICVAPQDKMFKDFLTQNWGRFCEPSHTGGLNVCKNCSLELPTWIDVDGNKSMAPTGGTLKCECLGNQGYKPTSIKIEKGVQYYENVNGELQPGPNDEQYCKTIGCDNCTCLNDADCQRWGCTRCGEDFKCV